MPIGIGAGSALWQSPNHGLRAYRTMNIIEIRFMDSDKANGVQLQEMRRPRPVRPGVDYASPRAKKSHGWVWLVLLVLVAAGVYFAWRHFAAQADATGKGRPDANRTIPVVTVTARKGDMN